MITLVDAVSAGWLPVVLALTAACMFGMAAITSKKGMAHLDPQVAVIVSLGASLCAFALSSPLWMRAQDWFSLGFWIFVVNGLFHPLLSMYFWMEAIKRAGATVASTLAAIAPLFAAITAVVFLNESITLPIAFGTLATVLGIGTLSWSRGGVTTMMKIVLLFAVAAAMVRGLNHTVGRFGMGLMPNPMMAAFVSCTVAFFGSLLMFCARNRRLPDLRPRAGFGVMTATGVLSALGITSMYGALSAGSVVVVSPLVATYPLFTLAAALLLAMERLTVRLAFGVALVVGGVVAITLGRG